MHKLYSYDVTFKEVPGQISLTLAFSGCKGTCEDCHSPHLRDSVGKDVTDNVIIDLLDRYGDYVNVVTFLGGESVIPMWSPLIRDRGLSVCLYTGEDTYDTLELLDFLKTGSYDSTRGGLDVVGTNQKMIDVNKNEDISHLFLV